MNLVVAAVLSGSLVGQMGAVIVCIAHGLVSVGLFFCVGCMISRSGNREDRIMVDCSGELRWCFFVLLFCNLAIPGSMNFIGEV